MFFVVSSCPYETLEIKIRVRGKNMSKCCVFYIGEAEPGKDLQEKMKAQVRTEEETPVEIHPIPAKPYGRRGNLANLIASAPTIEVFVNKSSVPESEINIARARKLSFHVEHNGNISHSSELN